MKTTMVFLLFCIHLSCFGQDHVNPVDVEILFEVTPDKAKDNGIIAAVKWLRGK